MTNMRVLGADDPSSVGLVARDERGRDMTTFRVDADAAITMLEAVIERMEKLDGTIAADPGGGNKNSAFNSRITKELLYVAHLARKAENAIMDQYFSYKGESAHERIGKVVK